MTEEKEYTSNELFRMFEKASSSDSFKFTRLDGAYTTSWVLNGARLVDFQETALGVYMYWATGVTEEQEVRVIKYIEKCCEEVDKEQEIELNKKTQLIEEALKGVC